MRTYTMEAWCGRHRTGGDDLHALTGWFGLGR